VVNAKTGAAVAVAADGGGDLKTDAQGTTAWCSPA